jgi:hypothetical protein
MATTSPTTPVVLTSEAVEALPLEPLGHLPDVGHRIVWQDGTSMAGVMRVGAGRRLGKHAHRVNHHHIWVIDGSAVILGETLGPGSYVHVPSGVDHDVDATGTDGCTVFYLYAGYGA